GRSLCRDHGYRDAKSRAPAQDRAQRDRMVEQSAQTVDDGKPKAEPGAPITLRFAEAIELAEYLLVLILWNPAAGVPHLDSHRLAAVAAANNQATVRGVAHRIGHQVEQDAFEQDKVAAHPGIARDDSQRQALFPGGAREGGLDSLEPFRQG